jgi:hypothetical protein
LLPLPHVSTTSARRALHKGVLRASSGKGQEFVFLTLQRLNLLPHARDTERMDSRALLHGFVGALASVTCSVALADNSLPGPYPVSQRTVTVTRSNNTTFSAQIRYPATSAAANAG